MALKAPPIGLFLVLATTSACTPCRVFGPLQRQQDEREQILRRARGSPVSIDVLNVVAPPLTPDELEAVQSENTSCRKSYMWKNALNWTGGILVGVAAGVTIGGAYATGNNDSTGKIAFGVSAGSLAALGAIFGAVGGIIQQSYSDRGCVVK
jgi:hypothetical protein